MIAARSRIASLGSSQSIVLLIICLGVFSTALDQTVVVAALPSVMVDLEIPLTDLDTASWIVIGYLVSYTVAMPLAGAPVRRLRPRQDVSSGTGFVLHRVGTRSSCAELSLGGICEGDTGHRRRRHRPHRPRYGSGSCSSREKGGCPRN